MNVQTIRACWAIHDSPALNRIKTLGKWEEARGFLLEEANRGLKRAYQHGDAPALAHCHALELAAEKYLRETA